MDTLSHEEYESSTNVSDIRYIIDNYQNLPEYMVFLHALRYQWHNEDPMYGKS